MSEALTLPQAEVIPRFKRFADNWGIPHTEDALKTFLACAADTALWRTNREELPDNIWEQFCALMTEALNTPYRSSSGEMRC